MGATSAILIKLHKINVGYFCNFNKTAQNKKSPIGRKFAQSGHPDNEPEGSVLNEG
jgi:hypothetical protein